MTIETVVVQASSRSWQGGPDLCMNEIDGRPAVEVVLDRVMERFSCPIVLAAPGFDADGALRGIAERVGKGRIKTHFGQDERPLERILAVTSKLSDEALILRIDGLHVCADLDASEAMARLAERDQLDCVKFPDDFPSQLASEV